MGGEKSGVGMGEWGREGVQKSGGSEVEKSGVRREGERGGGGSAVGKGEEKVHVERKRNYNY